MAEISQAAASIQRAREVASRGLVEREHVVEMIALAAVAGEHVLIIGPPGTAKSEAARRMAQALGGSYFEYLLGRFTEPSEIFGPVDLRRLRDGVVETETSGMLPEADLAFLDEVFQGSTAILNTLLGLLNERTFRRGHTRIACPLRVCIAASNALPSDESLAAFADRFLVQIFVEPVGSSRLEELLTAGWKLEGGSPDAVSSLADIDRLAGAARRADLSQVRPQLAEAVRLLRAADIELSDRRVVRAQRLIAAAAVLDGRQTPDARDLWPLVFAVPSAEQQDRARELLRDILERSQNEALRAAAEDAAAGPAARAARLTAACHELLEREPATSDESWRLEAEALAREIDASIAPDQLPEPLREARAGLVRRLESPTTDPANDAVSPDMETEA
ncbi:AAA family ATPase [Persicimonas caeni]|nr:AAA family ATPase [Persicimonas caeni]